MSHTKMSLTKMSPATKSLTKMSLTLVTQVIGHWSFNIEEMGKEIELSLWSLVAAVIKHLLLKCPLQKCLLPKCLFTLVTQVIGHWSLNIQEMGKGIELSLWSLVTAVIKQ